MTNILKKITRAIATVRQHRQDPLRLEFVLSDFCNLNCKGCTHYSPVAPKEFEPIESLKANMKMLGKACGDGVKKLFLIGGEPLLYPYLEEAMDALRSAFPKGELYIFTNGLQLPRMPESFWEGVKRNDIIISVTRYPIKFDYDAIERLCREKGVRTEEFADRGEDETFFRFSLDPEKRQNPKISHFKCFNRGCVSVIGDRIYPCSISGCIGHINARFGKNFQHEKGDWINVSEVRSADDIRRLRDRPVPFCGYCILPPKPTEYGPSSRVAEEWID